jgi:hypothetical protein
MTDFQELLPRVSEESLREELKTAHAADMGKCADVGRYSCLKQYSQPFTVAIIIVIMVLLVVYIFILNEGRLIIYKDDGKMSIGRTLANFAAVGAGVFGVGYFLNSLRCYVTECDELRKKYGKGSNIQTV